MRSCTNDRRKAVLGMLSGILLFSSGCVGASSTGGGASEGGFAFAAGGDPTTAVLIKDHIVVVTIGPGDALSVVPESAIVVWEGTKPSAASPNPVQVRWILDCVGAIATPRIQRARCLEKNETLLFRPKREQPSGRADLFQPNKDIFDNAFGIVAGTTSVASGLPREPKFDGTPLRWAYEVVLLRDGKEVSVLDPEVVIKKDH